MKIEILGLFITVSTLCTDVFRFRFNRRTYNAHKILAGMHTRPHTYIVIKAREITGQLPSVMLSKNCANKLAEKNLLKGETGPIPQTLNTRKTPNKYFPKTCVQKLKVFK